MQKVFPGNGAITPYRPWSEERKATARARIAQARNRLGWSQSELARRASVSVGTISRLAGENSSQPVNSVASAICAAVEAGLSEKLAEFARQLEPSPVPLLPAPRHQAVNGWHDASTAPTHVWILARSDESPRIRRVCYDLRNEWYPWVERNKKGQTRYRWDIFDCWRSEPVPL